MTSLLALAVSLRTHRLQQERIKLFAIVESKERNGKSHTVITVTVINRGPVPFTVAELGLEKVERRTVFAPKWSTNEPKLPTELKQGMSAVVVYDDDQIDTEPALANARYAFVRLVSGNVKRTLVKQISHWPLAPNIPVVVVG